LPAAYEVPFLEVPSTSLLAVQPEVTTTAAASTSSSVVDSTRSKPRSHAGTFGEGLIVDSDAQNLNYNKSGLNGLTQGGTLGLDSVSISWTGTCRVWKFSLQQPTTHYLSHYTPQFCLVQHPAVAQKKICCSFPQHWCDENLLCSSSGSCNCTYPLISTVQGNFTVTSSMPVQYTVQEVTGIFDLGNKVRCGTFACLLLSRLLHMNTIQAKLGNQQQCSANAEFM
jgi:hypothetical protein